MKYPSIILSVAAGSLLVWLGLLVRGYSVNVDDHVLYQAYLSEQLQNDLSVNQTVIDTHQALQPSSQSLDQDLHQITELGELEDFPSVLSRQNSQTLQKKLDAYRQTLGEKTDLAEQFQSQNLQLKESASALRSLGNRLQEDRGSSPWPGYDPELIRELANLAVLYAVSSDQALVTDIERNVAQVQTLLDRGDIRDRNDIETLLEHTRIILDNKPEVDQLIQSLLALPTTQQLQTLSNTYNDAYHTVETRTKLFQLAATLWGISMVGVAAYLVLLKVQSRKVEEITHFLSESIDDAFIEVDNRWMITYANTRAAQDLDKSSDDLIGQPMWDLLPAELGQQQERHYHEACDQQSLVTFETRFGSKSRWIELRLSPNKDGLSIFWQDISSRKKAEFQLALSLEANDEALKKAYEAQKKAETERLKSEKANQAKSEFLANMSHELRTPLNAIIGYSEMLEEDAEDLEQEDFIPELQKIQGAGKHLLGLINDVLDLSKVEAGHMEMYLETFPIMPLVQDVVSTMQPVIEKNNNRLKIQCDDDISDIYADEVKVRQSLFNLLSNASKFTQGGTITVSVSSEGTDTGQWINFKIQDTGIGMLPEQLQKIFNAFAQADSSTTRKYGGTGLGLTITKRFIQMMGGTVKVESDVGQGTTFTVRIPQTVTDALLPGDPADIPAVGNATIISADETYGKPLDFVPEQSIASLITAPSSECILVVDDDDENCKFIWKTLVSQGYFVVLTHNKRKGLKMVDQLLPDIILLDSIMLKKDEYDVFELLDRNPALANIPVIVQTKLPDKKLRYSLGKVDSLSQDNNLQDNNLKKLLSVLNTYHLDQGGEAYVGSGSSSIGSDIGNYGPSKKHYRENVST